MCKSLDENQQTYERKPPNQWNLRTQMKKNCKFIQEVTVQVLERGHFEESWPIKNLNWEQCVAIFFRKQTDDIKASRQQLYTTNFVTCL